MSPEVEHRNAAIAIAVVAVVAVSVFAVPAIINPPPQRKLIYEYSTLNIQVYPEYHRAYITIDQAAVLYLEFTISGVQDQEHYAGFNWELYNCDLATFDAHYSTNMSDPAFQDFRFEYQKASGGIVPQQYSDVFFDYSLKGAFTFVWWIGARNKVNSWPLSFKLYLQYK